MPPSPTHNQQSHTSRSLFEMPNDVSMVSNDAGLTIIRGQPPPPLASSHNNKNDEYIDTAIVLRCILKYTNLDFVYIFDKEPLSIQAIEKLKESLQQVLGYYPTLTGRLCSDGKRVHLNNHGIWFRVQQQETSSSIRDVIALEEPATGPPYCHIPSPGDQVQGKAPLLTVTVTNFEDGYTLGVVMNHIVADAWTFAQFIKDWSSIFNNNTIEPVISELPSVLVQSFPTLEQADDAAQACGMEKCPSWIKQRLFHYMLTYFIPKGMGPKDPRIGKTPRRMILHYTQDQVDQIKAKANMLLQKKKNNDSSFWISTNEAMLSHVWQLLLDAAGLSPSQRSCVGASIAVNLRNKLPGVSDRVAGNAVTMPEFAMDMRSSSEKNESIEERIHNSMRTVLQPERLALLIKAFNKVYLEDTDLVLYQNKFVGDANFGGIPGCIRWNWQVTNPYYKIDFGAGPPVRGIPWYWQQPVTVLPSVVDGGGLEVHIDQGKRGPVEWTQVPSSKWSKLIQVVRLASFSTAIAGGVSYAFGIGIAGNKSSGRSTSSQGGNGNIVWGLAASATTLGIYMLASRRRQGEIDAAKQAFHEYVKTHAHRGLK